MARTLNDLPPEVLHQICGHLCLHCRNPEGDAIPCFDNEHGRENKKDLAQLACTSKRLRQVVQPVLFHYFVVHSTFTVSAKRARDQVLAFLRVLCQRPDLADEVRALSLIPPTAYNDSYPMDHATWRIISTLEPVAREFPQHTLTTGRPNFRKPAKKSLFEITPWMLAAVPKLERLTMEVPNHNSFDEFKHLKPNPRLRILELIHDPGHIFILIDLGNLFRYASRVEILHAVDMSLLCAHHYGRGENWDAPRVCDHTPWEGVLPPTLHQISMSHVEISKLAHLFDSCPQLEDLEILLTYMPQWDWSTIPPPNGACEGIRRTLRRLVISYGDSYWWIEEPGGWDSRTGVEGAYYNANMGFRNFESLEILEVEQLFLHADLKRLSPQSLHELSRVIPERLRVLHIGYVASWAYLQPQLLDLISQKRAGNLSHLVIVRIDPWFEIEQESLKLVSDAMRDAGISFSVGKNPQGRSTRRLLPPYPKSLNETEKARTIQRTSFPLEVYGA
ncbi:hypothetical protein GQ53DRAFT_812776 [Thozetella sp. PMI_491]|nr:hypothetical protein GQ53DRAFT_812776 [Thozetella sp. PMI_491]